MRVGKAAAGAVARPRRGLERQQIVPKIEMNGDTFPCCPIAIRIGQKLVWESGAVPALKSGDCAVIELGLHT